MQGTVLEAVSYLETAQNRVENNSVKQSSEHKRRQLRARQEFYKSAKINTTLKKVYLICLNNLFLNNVRIIKKLQIEQRFHMYSSPSIFYC